MSPFNDRQPLKGVMPPEAEFRSVREDDLTEVSRQLSGIHRTAARIFRESWQAGRADAWILNKDDNKGVFATVHQDTFVVCFAAFDEGLPFAAVRDFIDLRITEVLVQRGTKPLFYNIRGDNQTWIEQAHQRGFKQDTLGYELSCQDPPKASTSLSGLTSRGYEEQYLDSYLTLLDAAFNPLLVQQGGRPGAFLRERETLKNTLAEKSARGEFAAIWQEQALAGLYYLKEDLIETLAVAPSFQNKGYGRLLLSQAVGHILGEGGYPGAYLFVVAANTAALKMYLRAGFTISGYYSENTYVGISV